MVGTTLIYKILKRLERFLIQKNEFQLSGENFNVILFIPSDDFLNDSRYSLVISSKILDKHKQKDLIVELLNDFKGSLTSEDYNSITRITVLSTSDPLVNNLKFMFGFRQEIIEIREIPIGGIRIDLAYLVKSLILDKLIKGNVSIIEFEINGQLQKSNAGIIRIDNLFNLYFYNGKGLRELFDPISNQPLVNMANKSENDLIQDGYISKINLEQILAIY